VRLAGDFERVAGDLPRAAAGDLPRAAAGAAAECMQGMVWRRHREIMAGQANPKP